MLDSDIGNTIVPNVRFYQREVKHEFNSEKEGRPIFYMADFVRIEIPGDRNTIIDTFASNYHKQTYPIQWARYQNEKRDLGDTEVTGTLLKDWPLLNPAQAAELKHLHFYTVEQVASASDEQISKIGMMLGMAASSFRDKAKSFLRAAKSASVVEEQQKELNKRDEEIQALKEQMAHLMESLQVEPAKKRGRKPKQEEPEAVG